MRFVGDTVPVFLVELGVFFVDVVKVPTPVTFEVFLFEFEGVEGVFAVTELSEIFGRVVVPQVAEVLFEA